MSEYRFNGIDILRSISMLFIITLHSLGYGGLNGAVSLGTPQYYVERMLLIVAYCGVDIFAVISGFIGYGHLSKHRLSSFLVLWLRVSFYSGIVPVIVFLLGFHSLCPVDLLRYFCPISNGSYWYFTAYCFVFLLAPSINLLLERSGSDQVKQYLVVGFLLLYLSYTITGVLHIVLLVYLYYVGAVLRKYEIHNKIRSVNLVIFILVLNFFTWVLLAVLSSNKPYVWRLLLKYESPIVIGPAICYVLLFAKLKVGRDKVLDFITPGVFSVYLINDHRLVRELLISDRFSWLSTQPIPIMIGVIAMFSIVFFTGSILIDYLRRVIERVAMLRSVSDMVENNVIAISVRLCNFLKKAVNYESCCTTRKN